MVAQTKKEHIISGLVETRTRILEAAFALPADRQDEIFLGTWSVTDLLAHLVGWDWTNLQAAQEILESRVPGFYARYDDDWKTYNAELVTRYKKASFADLLALARNSHGRLVEFLKTIPAGEYEKDREMRWQGDKVTLADLLEVEEQDEKTHYAQIVQAFRQHGKEQNECPERCQAA